MFCGSKVKKGKGRKAPKARKTPANDTSGPSKAKDTHRQGVARPSDPPREYAISVSSLYGDTLDSLNSASLLLSEQKRQQAIHELSQRRELMIYWWSEVRYIFLVDLHNSRAHWIRMTAPPLFGGWMPSTIPTFFPRMLPNSSSNTQWTRCLVSVGTGCDGVGSGWHRLRSRGRSRPSVSSTCVRPASREEEACRLKSMCRGHIAMIREC